MKVLQRLVLSILWYLSSISWYIYDKVSTARSHKENKWNRRVIEDEDDECY